MRNMVIASLVCFLAASTVFGLDLVRNGKSQSVIILDANNKVTNEAAKLLQRVVKHASGAEIQILSEPSDNSKLFQIIIGNGKVSKQHGFKSDDLKDEEYVIAVKDNKLFLFGKDEGVNNADYYSLKTNNNVLRSMQPATIWAVTDFLDREMGVRWLWPGKIGEYIPEKNSITIDAKTFRKGRPPLASRHIRSRTDKIKGNIQAEDMVYLKKLVGDFSWWRTVHQQGARLKLAYNHSFTTWYDKYHAANPDLFAKKPAAKVREYSKDRIKLCVSNPEVTETILKEWRAAGKPDHWPICPNDGGGFCTCEKCCAMDNANYEKIDIWNSKVDLSRRYAIFCSQIQAKMRKEKKTASIGFYAYSCYKYPPKDIEIGQGMNVQMVTSYLKDGLEQWDRWGNAGSNLMLRPNWWHMLHLAPFGELHKQGNFFKTVFNRKMIGYDFDSMVGMWGTQAPLYYMICRLSYRPELSVDDILKEFASAFGSAETEILEYLKYWEDYSEKIECSIPCGGNLYQNKNGIFEEAALKYKFSRSVLNGSWQCLPFLFSDKVVDPGFAILKHAAEKAVNDTIVQARIKFLSDGLRHLKAVRDTYAAANNIGMNVSEEKSAEMLKNLTQMRRQMRDDYVLVPSSIEAGEQQRKIKLSKKNKRMELDLRGL